MRNLEKENSNEKDKKKLLDEAEREKQGKNEEAGLGAEQIVGEKPV